MRRLLHAVQRRIGKKPWEYSGMPKPDATLPDGFVGNETRPLLSKWLK